MSGESLNWLFEVSVGITKDDFERLQREYGSEARGTKGIITVNRDGAVKGSYWEWIGARDENEQSRATKGRKRK